MELDQIALSILELHWVRPFMVVFVIRCFVVSMFCLSMFFRSPVERLCNELA